MNNKRGHYVTYLEYKVEAELGEINSVKDIYPVKREDVPLFLTPIFIHYFNDIPKCLFTIS